MESKLRHIITIEIVDNNNEADYLFDEIGLILNDLDSDAVLSMRVEDDAE